MTVEIAYKRLEQILIFFIIIGIVAMFQPWFRDFFEWLQPFVTSSEEANFGRSYRDEWAPIILRYGFFSTFLATVAYTSLTHYTIEDLEQAFAEKGTSLAFSLILLPILAGFSLLYALALGSYWTTILSVLTFIGATAMWNWKRQGVIMLSVSTLLIFIQAMTGTAHLVMSILLSAVSLLAVGLSIRQWQNFR